MNLTEKIAIVTGASSGIGAEFSRALVGKGATVYGLARRGSKLEAIRKELGEQFKPVVIDITDAGYVQNWVTSTFVKGLVPHILVNNAGTGLFNKVEDMTLDEWHTMMNINLSGVFYMTKYVVPLMKLNPDVCHIINISSVAGLIGNPSISGYNATKFGVRGFSEALMKELRYDGIKVSCMFPGSIATEFFDKAGSETHPNMMMGRDVATVLINLLELPDNFLIDEVTMRPLNPKPPEKRQ
ncbi:MAG: SDR family NAD(P)-dependent oxidoreductase [Balneolaceae bacterium]|jgi:short-subunit dehydrogenase|nr:MAG: SDR family NAD(P)-dependent oxidoreductase [Balneolaceae bacterium]